MIMLKGRVSKVTGDGVCLILIPNDTSIPDMLQVYSDKLEPGMPVSITIEPIKVRSAGAGFLSPAMG
jgi:hypothetical protein